ncbi:MAG: PspC domain-containing protein [Hellea sp.]
MTTRSKNYEWETVYEERAYNRNSFNGKRLRRNKIDGVLGGVCAGFGDYLGISHTIMRIIFVLCVIFLSFPLLAYVLLWVFVPKDERVSYRQVNQSIAAAPIAPAPSFSHAKSKFQSLEARLQDMERSITSTEWKLRRDFRDLEG